MHLHLDPVGGVAGDMFAAAVLDAFPELEPALEEALARAGLDALVRVERLDHRDHALTGSRVRVVPIESGAGSEDGREHHHHAPGGHDHDHDHGHRSYRVIRELLDEADLDRTVRERAQAMFAAIARAEGRVHGIAEEDVTFHEVGAWDSIADVVMAAWLIEHCGATGWSSTALPMGRGRVETAHGRLPIPAPATALLLEGIPLVQDEHEGERVTPTGAAIVAHLAPSFTPVAGARALRRSGTGFGTRTFPGMSNVLRLLAFDTPERAREEGETVAVCEFEVDDQTPEDLAVGLDRLRATAGVLDVVQMPVQGKKGRLASAVRVLTEPARTDAVVASCLTETTTIGVRWHLAERRVLPRESETVRTASGPALRRKRSRRPDGSTTAKVEMDDLAAVEGGHAARERMRRAGEDHR